MKWNIKTDIDYEKYGQIKQNLNTPARLKEIVCVATNDDVSFEQLSASSSAKWIDL